MQGTGEPAAATADGANELQQLLQQTIEHLHASTGGAAGAGEERHAGAAASGGAPDNQFLMRAHRQLLSLAQSQREPVVINDDPVGRRSRCLPLPRAVLPAALARRAHDRRAGAVPRGERGGLQRARRAPRRHPGAQGHRRHRVQLRRAERPVHAPGVRAARARSGGRAARAHSPGARSTSTSTSCTSSTRTSACMSAMRCSASSASWCAGACRPAPSRARISGDRFAVLLPTRLDRRRALRRIAARGRRAARRCCRPRTRMHVSISIGVALAGSGRGGARALARRGRDRLQGRQGSRPQSRRGLPDRRSSASCAASPTSTSPSSLREAIDAGPAAPGCAADPAVRRRRERPAALRAAAAHDRREGPDGGPGPLPLRRRRATS